jgi:UDP-N-acetylglucosamine 4-epimerase
MELWLVTGAAGFIGSHLAEGLLRCGIAVRGVDNFSSGYRANVDAVREAAGYLSANFEMIEADITDPAVCLDVCGGVDRVLHMAAIASVPRSIAEPAETLRTNQGGFVLLLSAARENGIKHVVYASSSAVYGDSAKLPAEEDDRGKPLSPYALSKTLNEDTAELYSRVYGMKCVGLRYFNVFGPRQDPNGAYAAVIPRWLDAVSRGERPIIYGDGTTTRDFCHVDDVVRANVLAATTEDARAFGGVFNVARGRRTSLNELFAAVRDITGASPDFEPIYEDFRTGDIRHSFAAVDRARDVLGYAPETDFIEGLRKTAAWYLKK